LLKINNKEYMKVLWITNILFPDICHELKIHTPVVGGWMVSLANELIKEPSIHLGVASVYNGDEMQGLEINNIKYYLLPQKKIVQKNGINNLETYWKKIKEDFQPNIIHIHGTELPYGLSYIKACGNRGTIISIQGLISIYARYYKANITSKEIWRSISLRDILLGSDIFRQKRKFEKYTKIENEYILSVKHIIGRTNWDKIHTSVINPTVNYYHCDEILRDAFYHNSWNYEECDKFSIFLSQGNYPIKGLHQVISAFPLVLRKYPKAKVYVAGKDITDIKTIKSKIKVTGYGRYINSLIKKFELENNVFFLGFLNEKDMCSQYLKSNVFVCPSSIENSPNSLGEAQILGVPCISSYVGGVADMIKDNESGCLYRFEETEILAEKICNIFSDVSFAKRISEEGRKQARLRHSKIKNLRQLLSIYNELNVK